MKIQILVKKLLVQKRKEELQPEVGNLELSSTKDGEIQPEVEKNKTKTKTEICQTPAGCACRSGPACINVLFSPNQYDLL